MLTNKLEPIQIAPGAFLPLLFNFDAWASTEGVSLASYTITPDAGVTISNEALSADRVTAWATIADDAQEGQRFEVICNVVGSGSPARKDSRGTVLVVTRL